MVNNNNEGLDFTSNGELEEDVVDSSLETSRVEAVVYRTPTPTEALKGALEKVYKTKVGRTAISLVVAGSLLAACWGNDDEKEVDSGEPEVIIMTPVPTFTPTLVSSEEVFSGTYESTPQPLAEQVLIPTPTPNSMPVAEEATVVEETRSAGVLNEDGSVTFDPTVPFQENAVVTGLGNAQRLNIRTEPGTGSAVKGSIAENEVLEVIGQSPDGQWVFGRNEYGDTGWFASTYVAVGGNVPTIGGTGGAETLSPEVITHAQYEFTGVPEVASNEETATGGFVNTIGKGTEMLFAEPGKLLISPDIMFDPDFEEKRAAFDAAGGLIEFINPDNQQELVVENQAFNIPGGGFAMVSTNHGEIELSNGTVIKFNAGPRSNAVVFIRGLYGDGQQDTDENMTGRIRNYSEGHGLYQRWTGNPNGGFISEGQFKQIVETTHTENTNCGDAGCSRVLIITLNAPTGTYTVAEHISYDGQFRDENYRLVDTNSSRYRN